MSDYLINDYNFILSGEWQTYTDKELSVPGIRLLPFCHPDGLGAAFYAHSPGLYGDLLYRTRESDLPHR